MRATLLRWKLKHSPRKKLPALFVIGVPVGVILLVYIRILHVIAKGKDDENISHTVRQREIDAPKFSVVAPAIAPLSDAVIVRSLTIDEVRNMSSIDYMACCGAGHRISKLSEASYAARILGFSLRSFWGYCDSTEVYNYLFGPQPLDELHNVTSFGQFVRINNEVPGFHKFSRDPHNSNCACVPNKATADVHFYSNHRDRFRARARIENFRRNNFFSNTTLVGLHVRAGNGESGDFADRGRTIEDLDDWIANVSKRIVEQNWGRPLLLFLATDTISLLAKFTRFLQEHEIRVVVHHQNRPREGEGVVFGERGKVLNTGNQCKQSWEDTFMDMILLSHTDVVIAARPSSFTQSMPMSLVLATPKSSRKVAKPFCELNPSATQMRCYEDFLDWCCNGETRFGMGDIRQNSEYLRMPDARFDPARTYKRFDRDPEGCIPRPEGWKQPCLPYDFSPYRDYLARELLRRRGNPI